MKKISLECDCGCGAIATGIEEYAGWLTLSQIRLVDKNSLQPKIQGEGVHFRAIECLLKWAVEAGKEIPKLQEAASKISPRGVFTSKKLRGICV